MVLLGFLICQLKKVVWGVKIFASPQQIKGVIITTYRFWNDLFCIEFKPIWTTLTQIMLPILQLYFIRRLGRAPVCCMSLKEFLSHCTPVWRQCWRARRSPWHEDRRQRCQALHVLWGRTTRSGAQWPLDWGPQQMTQSPIALPSTSCRNNSKQVDRMGCRHQKKMWSDLVVSFAEV